LKERESKNLVDLQLGNISQQTVDYYSFFVRKNAVRKFKSGFMFDAEPPVPSAIAPPREAAVLSFKLNNFMIGFVVFFASIFLSLPWALIGFWKIWVAKPEVRTFLRAFVWRYLKNALKLGLMCLFAIIFSYAILTVVISPPFLAAGKEPGNLGFWLGSTNLEFNGIYSAEYLAGLLALLALAMAYFSLRKNDLPWTAISISLLGIILASLIFGFFNWPASFGSNPLLPILLLVDVSIFVWLGFYAGVFYGSVFSDYTNWLFEKKEASENRQAWLKFSAFVHKYSELQNKPLKHYGLWGEFYYYALAVGAIKNPKIV
jgi:hypothetical protein